MQEAIGSGLSGTAKWCLVLGSKESQEGAQKPLLLHQHLAFFQIHVRRARSRQEAGHGADSSSPSLGSAGLLVPAGAECGVQECSETTLEGREDDGNERIRDLSVSSAPTINASRSNWFECMDG